MNQLGAEYNEVDVAYHKFLESGVDDPKLKKRLETRLLELRGPYSKIIAEHDKAYQEWAATRGKA